MEMNKEEAHRCKEIGIKHLRAGNYQQACKFLDKSLKLYPLPGVEALRDRAVDQMKKGSSTAAASKSAKRNATSTAGHTDSKPAPESRPYTQEQVEMVMKIKRCQTHYEVLGLDRSSDENDVKRAYKKLALKLHPDKNSAPGAEDAFKAVGKAVSVLSDPQKRAHYDKYGNDEPAAAGGERRGYHEQEVSPEEIFNMFFGGGGGPRGMYRSGFAGSHHRQHGNQHPQERGGIFQFLQLLPLLVVFFLSFFSYPNEQEYPFSFYQTEKFPIRRLTNTRKVIMNLPYYVNAEFDSRYARDWRELNKIEKTVERMHIRNLEDQCHQETIHARRLIYHARSVSNREKRDELMRQALEVEKPACDKLQSYGIATP